MMDSIWAVIALAYLFLVNIIGFAAMGMDKSRARRGAWRIREQTLFLWAVLGGSVGSILGMAAFHHKTKHWYFKFGMPLILLLQLGLCAAVLYLRR